MNIALTPMTRPVSMLMAMHRVVAALCMGLVLAMQTSACKRSDPSEHSVQHQPASTLAVALNITPMTDQLIVMENVVATTSTARSRSYVDMAGAFKRPSYVRHDAITVTHMPVAADLKMANPYVGSQITVKM